MPRFCNEPRRKSSPLTAAGFSQLARRRHLEPPPRHGRLEKEEVEGLRKEERARATLARAPNACGLEISSHIPRRPTVKLTFRLIARSEEHTSELQSQSNTVCRLL